MNWPIWLAVIGIVLVAGVLVIIRDAITIDSAKASAALKAFAARFKRKPDEPKK